MSSAQPELFVKMVLDAWHLQVKRTDDLIQTLTDENLKQEVSSGRNTGTYLLGHLIAVHDKMISLLGFGEPLYPQLYDTFVAEAHDPGKAIPPVPELRQRWKKVSETLASHFSKLKPEEWFQRHMAVSEEDFSKEPHRNKLNLIINRTNHLEYHRGQLVFLKAK
jgi:hypothetical protein